ncbi:helix-turn-helix transcriptional regulator [Aliiroseovarius sp. PTFE2010]|uniref:helix-turn-helix transcriptional regulator n=1 Tax=Aliiroseovarius sp. PTFE2010 TaxID=3417190 RepID=UPI003CED27B7
MRRNPLVIATVAVQAACAVFFVWDIFSSLFGLRDRPISWQARELIEIGAALGLVLGVVMGGLLLRATLRRQRAAEARLHRASSEFMQVLDERFDEWGLTPAERDVAFFAVKGMSTGEIAALRDTSEGTVKAQTNAIYRKAGVGGRPQLLALFLDDLIDLPGPANS